MDRSGLGRMNAANRHANKIRKTKRQPHSAEPKKTKNRFRDNEAAIKNQVPVEENRSRLFLSFSCRVSCCGFRSDMLCF